MVRLGLTGGIGSGKSTVAALLTRAGAGLVDADAISRQVTSPGGKAVESVQLAFGQAFIAQDGGLERGKLRELVFSDPQARQRLEDIIHPLVHLEARQQSKNLSDSGSLCIVFDIPLLIESRFWRQNVDKVLVIDCTPEVQIRRTSLRSSLDSCAVEKIIQTQAGRTTRLKAADLVICNNSLTLDELALEVDQVCKHCGL